MKEAKKILIISPAFPPEINGLGDYSAIVGKELIKKGNVDIIYAGLSQSDAPTVAPYYEINSRNTIRQIVFDHKIQTIFVNYSNYGYQRKGVPFWLLKALKEVENKNIHIFFHELNATAYKPWQLVFWLKPIQVYLYKNLAKISETMYCSNDIVYPILAKKFSNKLIRLGIFANIPEPTIPLKGFTERDNIAVVFGSYGRRKLVYQEIDNLNNFVQAHDIKSIIDIGNGDIGPIANKIDIPVISKGILPDYEIAKLLENLKYGFISYPSSMFGKSGIFAAYAAYGLVIYNLDRTEHRNEENLKEHIHYLPYHYNNHLSIDYTTISEKITLWYNERNVSKHIQSIYQGLIQT